MGAQTQSRVIKKTIASSPKCCAVLNTSTSLWRTTWTHQSGRIILKKLDPMECFEPAVVTVTHYHQSLPCPTHTNHTHTSWSLYKHPHMTRESTRAHTLLHTQTQRHTWAKEHGQQGHPRAMLRKGHCYNRFTVTLMTAGIQSGWKWRPSVSPFLSISHLMTRRTDRDGTACYQRTPLKVSWLTAGVTYVFTFIRRKYVMLTESYIENHFMDY